MSGHERERVLIDTIKVCSVMKSPGDGPHIIYLYMGEASVSSFKFTYQKVKYKHKRE